MPDERRQFRILNRDFLSRMVDLELIAAGGDPGTLITRFGAMLASLSFILTYLMVMRYMTSDIPRQKLAVLARGDEEFLISATITLAGLCAVMAWNTVFPDRRDSLILGLIPVRARTMILARVAAIGTVLGGVILALNLCTGLTFPFALSEGVINACWAFVTWWLVIILAGVFTFCSGLVLQGIAAHLLPWRGFLRISGFLQMAMLFVVLALLFLTPPFDPVDPPIIFPSFWFVGLLHVLRGDSVELFAPLAMRAVMAMVIVIPLAALVYVLSWSRNLRRIVESPEILPAKNPRIANWLARVLASAPFERAIVQFTARTLVRSRQHRMMLAIYGGFAFAISLAFSASMLNASHKQWGQPSAAFALTGFLLLSCAIVGIRTIFALPITLPANWIFRITAVHRPAEYFGAARKSLYVIAATPVLAGLAICYFALWPGRPAFEHVLVLWLLTVLIVERSLYQFRKIPFACSWLPGYTQGKMKTGIWACVFFIAATSVAELEMWSMEKFARLAIWIGVLGAFALRARLRTSSFAAEPDNRVQFDDLPATEIFALDLRQDGTWSSDEAYVETIDPTQGRGLLARLRPFALGFAVLLLGGATYEWIGEWKDQRAYPQVGRSVDIGGRSLNLYCSGTGSPAVVFDSGSGQPGYSWLLVQPGVAKMTRSCWYDRAGYGWSDFAPGVRTSADIAEDLHRLLRAAGVPPPYVLVGHSFGGFNVRVYANRYRNEVAGMVLVDSADEFESPLPDASESPEPPLEWRVMARTAQVLFHFGLGRLIVGDAGVPPGRVPDHDWALLNSVEFQEKQFVATLWENRGVSAAQVQAVRSLGSIPLVVLTAAATLPPPGSAMSAGWPGHMRHRIYGTQAALAKLSTKGEQRILERSSHAVPFDAPLETVSAVQSVLTDVRGRER